jgi:hypothetical protein
MYRFGVHPRSGCGFQTIPRISRYGLISCCPGYPMGGPQGTSVAGAVRTFQSSPPPTLRRGPYISLYRALRHRSSLNGFGKYRPEPLRHRHSSSRWALSIQRSNSQTLQSTYCQQIADGAGGGVRPLRTRALVPASKMLGGFTCSSCGGIERNSRAVTGSSRGLRRNRCVAVLSKQC